MIRWWFGLPGAGKTTAASAWATFRHAVLLDADVVRKACDDWDLSREGRFRQARRLAQLAHALHEQGFDVAVAACAAEASMRAAAASLCPGIEFIHVDTSRVICEQRRPRLYAEFGRQIPDTEC